MPKSDWMKLGAFGAALVAFSLYNRDAAMWVAGGVAAVLLLTHPDIFSRLFGG